MGLRFFLGKGVKKQDVVTVAKLLKLQNVRGGGEWVQTSCPFTHLHLNQKDEHPSFGISTRTPSRYYCFTCQSKGLLYFLPTAISFATTADFSEARKFIFSKDSFVQPNAEDFTEQHTGEISPMDNRILQSFAKLPEHIRKMMNLLPETIKKYRVSYDPASQRIIFPIFNAASQLVGIRGRYIGVESKAKYLSYKTMHPEQQDAKSYGIFYLMHEPLIHDSPLTLVEGERDALALRESGKFAQVWAGMGSSLSSRQLENLLNLRNKIVLFFDNDQAGDLATKKVCLALHKLNKLYRITDYCGCKDPAEIYLAGKLNASLRSITAIN